MANDGFNAHSFFVDNVASVSAPDDYTVAFELTQPNSRFHTTFLDRWGCTWIMPKHIFEGVEDPVTFEFNPFVGTGPYKLHSYDREWLLDDLGKAGGLGQEPNRYPLRRAKAQVHRLPVLCQ